MRKLRLQLLPARLGTIPTVKQLLAAHSVIGAFAVSMEVAEGVSVFRAKSLIRVATRGVKILSDYPEQTERWYVRCRLDCQV